MLTFSPVYSLRLWNHIGSQWFFGGFCPLASVLLCSGPYLVFFFCLSFLLDAQNRFGPIVVFGLLCTFAWVSIPFFPLLCGDLGDFVSTSAVPPTYYRPPPWFLFSFCPFPVNHILLFFSFLLFCCVLLFELIPASRFAPGSFLWCLFAFFYILPCMFILMYYLAAV